MLVNFSTGASFNGRALAQTAVTRQTMLGIAIGAVVWVAFGAAVMLCVAGCVETMKEPQVQKAYMVMPVPQVKQRPCDWCGSTSARYHCVDVPDSVLCTECIADWVASGMNDE